MRCECSVAQDTANKDTCKNKKHPAGTTWEQGGARPGFVTSPGLQGRPSNKKMQLS